MKRDGFRHLKLRKLARLLGISHAHAVGIAESLWHVTAIWRPRGDIGGMTNEAIAGQMGEAIEPDRLMASLVQAGLLDKCKHHRLVVHDWHEHADVGVRMKLRHKGLEFVKASADE